VTPPRILAGLLTAHDAYGLSLKGKTDVVIGGLGRTAHFLAFAQRDGGTTKSRLPTSYV
jgi:hypothetical protein